MNNIKSRIKYITDLEFKIEDKYLILGGYYNSLKKIAGINNLYIFAALVK